ncbi:restriction endonuclease subunit S [Halomonas sp. G15]|uniref:restriction endonuclease subunit S n=1 Tax=Halomonas sp. G15 TaxID=2903521 RepID=UPI001E3C5CB7|nr:restriction endonuclease subunit S [Halomonas sp. G15]MCE0734147.1 restriction endonuclease subunit S [Halomonas sp. G15]
MSARELITEHLDLWTGAVTHKSTAGRGRNGKIDLTGIKKLRELILELAVRGKLVEQDPDDEPASVLLERIAEEKDRLVKEGKIKKPKKLPEITEEDRPFELPDSWEWVRLGDLCELENGDRSKNYPNKSSLVETGVPFVNAGHLQNHSINTSELTFITEEKFNLLRSGKFRDGDILFCLRGSLGKFGVVRNIERGAVASSLIIARPYLSLLVNYTELYLKAPISELMIRRYDNGTAQPNLSGADFSKFLIPFPGESEQHRIVKKVDELMALCDRLEQQVGDQLEAHEVLVDTLLDALTCSADAAEVAENWARLAEHFDTLFTTEASIDKLKQAILQLAVMGRLVEQDPNDEPASVLLEKIAEEKTRLIKERKIKKSKVTPKMQEETIPFDIPKNWEWCRLESLTLYSESGWSPQCNSAPRSEDGWGVLKVSAVSWGKFNPNENKGLPDSLSPRKELEVRPSDFLISRANTADLVARSVIVPTTSPEKLMLSDKIIRVVLSKKIYPPYINIFNNSAYAREYYSSVAGGTSHSMKNVSRDKINQLAIALPPLNEQIRILEVVENLLLLCEKINVTIQVAADGVSPTS